jgi:hypothetical protein
MQSIVQDVMVEVADNWPAFVYIALTIGFSFLFLRERRAETRYLRELGSGLQESIRHRFDQVERLIEQANTKTTPNESFGISSELNDKN